MLVSRVENTKRNIVAVLIASGGEMIFSFVTRTALLYILGSEYVGLSGLFTSILRVMNMMEIGFASTVAFSMYKPIAEANDREVCALLNYSRKIYRTMGAAMMAFGIAILPFIPYMIKDRWPEGINIYVLFILYLLDTVLEYFFFSYYSSLVTALQQISRIRLIRLIVHAIKCAFQIAVLAVTGNYYLFMVSSIASTLLINITLFLSVRKDHPSYVPKGSITDELKEAIRKRVLGILLGYAGGIVFSTVASITLSKYHGLTSLAVYDNYYLIFGGIYTVFSYITEAMKASIGNSMATESIEKNYADLKKFTFIFMWLTSVCTICMLCMYQPFMELWAGRDLMISNRSSTMFAVAFYFSNMTAIIGTYFNGAGLWWKMKGFYMADIIISIFLPLLMGRIFAIAGVMFAFVIQNLFLRQIPTIMVTFGTYFKDGLRNYAKEIALNLILTIAVGLLSYYLCSMLHGGLIIKIIGCFLICFFVSNFALILTSIRTRDFKEAYGFIKDNIR